MMLYIRDLQSKFNRVAVHSYLSAPELQALLRSLSIPISATEAEIFLEKLLIV